MADIKIRVGASLDSDPSAVFRPLVEGARKARQTINSEGKAMDKEQARNQIAIAKEVFQANSKLNLEMAKGKLKADESALRTSGELAKEKIKRELALKLAAIKTASEAEKTAAKADLAVRLETMRQEGRARRDEERKNRPREGGAGGLIGYFGGRHIVNSAGRSISSLARGAMGVAGSIAGGLGVDFDIASITRRNAERQQMALDIANSAYQPGAAGAAGQKQDPNAIRAESMAVANKYGLDATKVQSGVKEFVALTGDLETGRKILGDIGMVARATGSDFEAVAEAAGNVSAKLPDTADKGAKVTAVLRAIAGQGKLGAAELRQMAPQMASLAAAAQQFGGDKMQNIAMMGVLLQEARQRGGAKSAAQAGTSVMSFVNTFSKGARAKAFSAMGIKTTDATGALRGPEEIILESLQKTKGNNLQMGKLFADVRARTAVRGFENIYRDASGGKTDKASVAAGLDAVRAEFKKLKEIAITGREAAEEAAKASDSDEAKAQRFQNQLDEVGRGLATKLQPALEKLAPYVLQAATAFGKVVEWATTNPGLAITAAIVGSIAKAGLGEVIARAIGISSAESGVAGSLGRFASTLGVAALAIGALGLAADQAYKLWKELHPETSTDDNLTPQERDKLLHMTKEEKQAATAAAMNKSELEKGGYNVGNQAGPIDPRVAQLIEGGKLTKVNEEQLKALQGTLRVEIVNIGDIQRGSGDLPNNSAKPPDLGGAGVTTPLSMPQY